MSKRTGDHNARRTAAQAEPSPITALRDMLATAFAADIAAVTPEVCELLRVGMSAESNPAKRDILRNALVVLARQSGELSLAIIAEVRARFDAKLAPGDDPFAKTSQFSMSQVSLVEDSALALDLALDQCSARLREQTSAEVFQLTARMCEMLGRQSLADAENPILPRLFARALIEATSKLGLDNEGNLAVFKAFGPALLHIAPDLYVHANTLLSDRGVLAGFNATYGRPVIRPSESRAVPPALPTDPIALAALLERLMSGKKAAQRL
jgi:Protein of unknown function (DUF1631)